MARSRYEYGTNPRKIQPEVERRKQVQKKRIRVVEDLPKQDVRISNKQKKEHMKLTFAVVSIFVILLAISYRNSQINEKFNQLQTLKRELSTMQKENEQLEVSIQNSVNLNTIEKLAKEKLGMQKLTNKQTMYVTLPKKDYVESASEEVEMEEEKNWLEQFIEKIIK
jgi:cell division protein FtsL